MTRITDFERVTGMTVREAQDIHLRMSSEAWLALSESIAATAIGKHDEARALKAVASSRFSEQESLNRMIINKLNLID